MLKKWFGSLLFFLVYHICISKGLVTVRNEVAKVMFLHVSVCPRGGGSASVHAGMPPSQEQAHPPCSRHSPGAGTPRSRHPPKADGYCCGRYASYWNAFLLKKGDQILQAGSKINKYLLEICSEFFLFVWKRVSASMSEDKVRAGQ